MSWRPPAPPFPSGRDIPEIADWVELTVAATGSRVGRGKLQTTMAREDAGDITAVADVWADLQTRQDLFGPTWPYKLDETGLALRTSAPVFAINVFLSALGLRTNIDSEGRELFEHTVTHILQGFVGNGTLRLGSPRRHPVATSLTDAVRDYFIKAHEEPAILRPFPTSDGDLGLDVAGWITFGDTRGGYLHVVGQCATGADWKDKLSELNIHKWNDHVNWSVPPVRFFALPFIVRSAELRRVTLDGGIILDRPRLVRLAARAPRAPKLLQRIRSYCDSLYSS